MLFSLFFLFVLSSCFVCFDLFVFWEMYFCIWGVGFGNMMSNTNMLSNTLPNMDICYRTRGHIAEHTRTCGACAQCQPCAPYAHNTCCPTRTHVVQYEHGHEHAADPNISTDVFGCQKEKATIIQISIYIYVYKYVYIYIVYKYIYIYIDTYIYIYVSIYLFICKMFPLPPCPTPASMSKFPSRGEIQKQMNV